MGAAAHWRNLSVETQWGMGSRGRVVASSEFAEIAAGGFGRGVARVPRALPSASYLVRVHDVLGLEHVQWHGRCEGGCGRASIALTEMAERWLCEDCWVIALSASLWAG